MAMRSPPVIRLLLTAVILICCSASGAEDQESRPMPVVATADFGRYFSVLQHRHLIGGKERLYEAFLFAPRRIEAGRRYPLIVWLHGIGEVELHDPLGALKWLPNTVFYDSDQLDSHEFFMLVPRCRDPDGWLASGFLPQDIKFDANNLLEATPADYFLETVVRGNPIDDDRVSLVGISAGAQQPVNGRVVGQTDSLP